MKDVIEKASSYIMDNGTLLQKACISYVLGVGDKDDIVSELFKYQNSDGGFSNGLEIEYLGPISSPFTTAVALGHISRFNLDNKVLISKTLNYLSNNQRDNGSWDDSPEMLEYEHPPYMGPNVYVDFKTGMILKWLQRLTIADAIMISKAQRYLLNNFDNVAKGNDFWSAVAYSSAFAAQPQVSRYSEIMEWCMGILMPKQGEFEWQQAMGMIEDDMKIPDQVLQKTMKLIKDMQQEDGGWPHQFGTYNRVWSAIYIVRFINKKAL